LEAQWVQEVFEPEFNVIYVQKLKNDPTGTSIG
jgi:hypothetical protein